MLDRDNGGNSEIIKPNYELSIGELSILTRGLLSERASDVPENHRYVAIEVNNDSKYANIGRYIERTVFEEAFGNDANEMTKEYGPYESASKFFISIDRVTEQPIGVLRIISNSQSGLKTINDVIREPFNVNLDDVIQQHNITDLNKVWDIGTVAILPNHLGSRGLPTVRLYRAIYKASLERGVDYWVSIVDDDVLQMVKDHFGIPFMPLANSKTGSYLGSEKSHAVCAYVPEFFEKMGKYMGAKSGPLNRRFYELLVDGGDDNSILLDQQL